MKTPVVVGLVIGAHVVLISALVLMQGCNSIYNKPKVEPAAATVAVGAPSTLSGPAGVKPAEALPTLAPPTELPVSPAVAKETSAAASPVAARSHTVAAGESLGGIAKKYGVRTSELTKLNSIKDPKKLKVGQTLVLPAYSKESSGVAAPEKSAPVAKPPIKKSKPVKKAKEAADPAAPLTGTSAAPAETASAAGGEYAVKSGDTLGQIAKKHGMTVKTLREANGLKSDRLKIGQKLVIAGAAMKESEPAAAAAVDVSAAPVAPVAVHASVPAIVAKPVPAAPAAPAVSGTPTPAASAPDVSALPKDAIPYIFQEGDTVEGIAKMFMVSKENILKLNKISNPAAIKPGQKLMIPSA